MLLTIVAVLVVLWLLGWLAFNLGAFIHILLIAALVILIWNFIAGSRTRV